MIEQKRKEINGTVYLVDQMDGVRALKAQVKLLKLLGSTILNALSKQKINFEKSDNKEILKEILKDNILLSLADKLSSLDENEVLRLIALLFEKGIFEEKTKNELKIPVSIDYETYFTGKPFDLWKVAAFIVEANFSLGK